jgi:RecJ-like exonuclease
LGAIAERPFLIVERATARDFDFKSHLGRQNALTSAVTAKTGVRKVDMSERIISTQPCQDCHGTGRCGGQICNTCNGKGYVPIYEKERDYDPRED